MPKCGLCLTELATFNEVCPTCNCAEEIIESYPGEYAEMEKDNDFLENEGENEQSKS